MASGRSGKRGKGGAGRGGAGKGQARTRERERLLADAARVELPRHADVCVIGGGAAGLVAAIAAREAGARVVVLERDLACGRTILATGNGRCNFCNVALEPEHYNHPDLAAAVMGEPAEALEDVLGFFRGCGLAWAEEDGRLYPRSRQAASVRNVLLARCWRDGVTLAPARVRVATQWARLPSSASSRWDAGPLAATAQSTGDSATSGRPSEPASALVPPPLARTNEPQLSARVAPPPSIGVRPSAPAPQRSE